MNKADNTKQKSKILLYCINETHRRGLLELLDDFNIQEAASALELYRILNQSALPSLIVTDSIDFEMSSIRQEIPIILVCPAEKLKSPDPLPDHIWDLIPYPFQPAVLRRRIRSYISESFQIQNDKKQLNLLFDLIPFFIFVKNKEGRFLAANKALADHHGLQTEDIVGTLQGDLQRDKKLLDKMLKEDQLILKTGETLHNAPIKIRDRKGNPVWLQTTKCYCPPEIFGEEAVIGISVNITELKAAEEKLLSSRASLKNIIMSIGDALIVTDPEGRITNMNPAAENMTGSSIEEALEKPVNTVFRILNTETGKIAENSIAEFLSHNASEGDARLSVLLSRDNRQHKIINSGNPISRDKGEIRGEVLVFRDMTDELNRREKQQHSEKMDAIGKLAGGVAHDFNNILSGTLSASELLQMAVKDNEKADEYVKLIRQSTQKATELTGQLLNFSGRGSKSFVPMDVNKSVLNALTELQEKVDKRVKIDFNLEAAAARIKGDPTNLQRALIDIGLNAAHAMRDGGVLGIRTGTRTLDNEYCRNSLFSLTPGDFISIEISDSGEGIDTETLPHIFEPFFTTKRGERAYGLGLSCAFSTVKQLMGAIEVQSRPGKGSLFTILLPLAELEPSESEKKSIPSQGFTSGSILVVDDEPVIRKTLSDLLENAGYSVTTAENGTQGLFQIRKRPDYFDLVIMDMIMPEMTGSACFDAIRRINPYMKILFISGYFQDHNMRTIIESEQTGFIHKPFNRDTIIEKVKEMIQIS